MSDGAKTTSSRGNNTHNNPITTFEHNQDRIEPLRQVLPLPSCRKDQHRPGQYIAQDERRNSYPFTRFRFMGRLWNDSKRADE